jgi:hypothetical protein
MTKKIFKPLASLKLAVIVVLALSVLIATGTIIEARYDAAIASKLVYRTWWMYTTLSVLVVSLVAVMVDRWPWKKKHTPFILAHIGIIVLLFGAFLTTRYGLDGSLRIPLGGAAHYVVIPKMQFSVYSSFDGEQFTKLESEPVDFYLNPPEKNPISVQTDSGALKVEHYLPFAVPEKKVKASDGGGPAVRFQLNNERANFTEWLVDRKPGEKSDRDLGPAKVTLLSNEGKDTKDLIPKKPTGKNEIILQAFAKDSSKSGKIRYGVFYKDGNRKPARKPMYGEVEEGGKFQTGWMGLEFHVLRYLPSAEETWEFEAQERPTELTTEAIEISYQGKNYWLQLDDVLKLYSKAAVYIVSFAHQRVDLGFELKLKNFEVGHYQGTMKASSYKSLVAVPGEGDHLIAMNEPLKFQGLTFYQASFQTDPATGAPTASIFSVNQDPGRWFKYLGSLILVMGTILLFYNRRKAARAQAPATNAEFLNSEKREK